MSIEWPLRVFRTSRSLNTRINLDHSSTSSRVDLKLMRWSCGTPTTGRRAGQVPTHWLTPSLTRIGPGWRTTSSRSSSAEAAAASARSAGGHLQPWLGVTGVAPTRPAHQEDQLAGRVGGPEGTDGGWADQVVAEPRWRAARAGLRTSVTSSMWPLRLQGGNSFRRIPLYR
jgi:hypothetical protein